VLSRKLVKSKREPCDEAILKEHPDRKARWKLLSSKELTLRRALPCLLVLSGHPFQIHVRG